MADTLHIHNTSHSMPHSYDNNPHNTNGNFYVVHFIDKANNEYRTSRHDTLKSILDEYNKIITGKKLSRDAVREIAGNKQTAMGKKRWGHIIIHTFNVLGQRV